MIYHPPAGLKPAGGCSDQRLNLKVWRWPVQVLKAVFFGLAGEVTQVSFKVGDQSREGSESRVDILAATDSEKIIRGFSGGFGHRTISDYLPPFSSVL